MRRRKRLPKKAANKPEMEVPDLYQMGIRFKITDPLDSRLFLAQDSRFFGTLAKAEQDGNWSRPSLSEVAQCKTWEEREE